MRAFWRSVAGPSLLQFPDREGEIGVGVGLVFEDEVPPLFGDGFEAVFEHQGAEEHPVGVLLLGDGRLVVGMGFFAEPVEAIAHVDVATAFHVHEREVDDRAAGVAAAAGDVAAVEDDVFVEIGIEIALGQGISDVFTPAAEMVHGHLRAVGVPDFEAIAERHRLVAHGLERLCGLAGHQRDRFLVSVHARAHEIEGAVVADFQDDIRHDVGQHDEPAGIVRPRRPALAFCDLLLRSAGNEEECQNDQGEKTFHRTSRFRKFTKKRNRTDPVPFFCEGRSPN